MRVPCRVSAVAQTQVRSASNSSATSDVPASLEASDRVEGFDLDHDLATELRRETLVDELGRNARNAGWSRPSRSIRSRDRSMVTILTASLLIKRRIGTMRTRLYSAEGAGHGPAGL